MWPPSRGALPFGPRYTPRPTPGEDRSCPGSLRSIGGPRWRWSSKSASPVPPVPSRRGRPPSCPPRREEQKHRCLRRRRPPDETPPPPEPDNPGGEKGGPPGKPGGDGREEVLTRSYPPHPRHDMLDAAPTVS